MNARLDIAVDLGTTSTLVYVHARGIVLCEPSLVAIESRTGDVRAVGIDARRLLEREGGSTTGVRPVGDGAIKDFDLTVEMLRRFIRKACRSSRARPRIVVVGVPRGATVVERRAVEEACLSAGARHTYLIEEPMAAAIGAGLPVTEAAGSLVVDIGGGTTEVALISLGEVVISRSVRAGGEGVDEAIVRHLKRERELLIGQRLAEEIKFQIGSAFPDAHGARVEVRGFGSRSAVPKTVVLTSEDIRGPVERSVARIIDAVQDTLSRTPPELSSDIIDRGMILAGGGSLLRGLEERLRQETDIPAHVVESPLTCVAAGAGAWLELNSERLRESQSPGITSPAVGPDWRASPRRRGPDVKRPPDAPTPSRHSDARETDTEPPMRISGREMIGMTSSGEKARSEGQKSSPRSAAGQARSAGRFDPERNVDRSAHSLLGGRGIDAAERDGLLSDARNIDFPTALRGYARSAVDLYVQRVNRLIAELEISSSPQAAVRHALAEASEEAGEILRRGHQTADEVIARSRAEADDIHRQAAQKAMETLEAAQAEARETREAAQREARELREMTAGEAKALREIAQHEAAESRETTVRQMAELRQAAVDEAQQLRAAAESDAEEIRSRARHRSDEILALAETRNRELAREAEAMWRECQRLVADARMAGERLITIGERTVFTRPPEPLLRVDEPARERAASATDQAAIPHTEANGEA